MRITFAEKCLVEFRSFQNPGPRLRHGLCRHPQTHPKWIHILNKDVTPHHLGQGEVDFQHQGKLQSNSIPAEWMVLFLGYLFHVWKTGGPVVKILFSWDRVPDLWTSRELHLISFAVFHVHPSSPFNCLNLTHLPESQAPSNPLSTHLTNI